MRKWEGYLMNLALYIAPFDTLQTRISAHVPTIISILLVGLLIIHMIVERPRWQFLIYYPIISYHAFQLFYLQSDDPNQHFSYLWTVFLELITIATCFIACVVPVSKLLPLKGKYRTVGVVNTYLQGCITKKEAWLEETISTGTGIESKRVTNGNGESETDDIPIELVCRIFYPSAVKPPSANQTGAPYITPSEAKATARFAHLPTFLLSHMPLMRCNAVENAPFVSLDEGESKHPTVIFSHGLGGCSSVYTLQAEALASAGFVVLLPIHNDGSACISHLPDGRTINYTGTPIRVETPEGKQRRRNELKCRVREILFAAQSLFDANKTGNWKIFLGWDRQKNQVVTMPAIPFASRVDIDRISLMGHSYGGASVLAAAHVNETIQKTIPNSKRPAIQGVVSLDQWMYPLHAASVVIDLEIPLLSVVCDTYFNHWKSDSTALQELYKRSVKNSAIVNNRNLTFDDTTSPTTHVAILAKVEHSNFSDVPLMSPFFCRKMKAIGTLDWKKATEIINNVSIDFLNDATGGSAFKRLNQWKESDTFRWLDRSSTTS